MNKRLRRPLSALITTLCGVTFLASTGRASAPEVPIWRLHATPVDGVASELREIRLASPTTYVTARRGVADGGHFELFDATIFVGDWSLRAARLTIDVRVDAIEIITLRTDAPKE